MAVTTDIIATWRRPRAVMRRHLAAGRREDRALAFVFGACLVMFIARWPALARAAHLDPSVPLDARMGITLFSMMFVAPLAFYALGALSHLAARLAGGRGSFYGARLALFWALLAASPAMLFQGLVSGFIGPGPAQTLVGYGVLAAFLVIWAACLRVAEFERE